MALPPIAGRVEAVVIGTSAGGVDALAVLLPALPPRLRPPVFVVLHLPRERPSLLPEIFGPKCVVPVREALDKEAVEPGTVYFAPPDYHLLIEGAPAREGAAHAAAGPALALSDDEPVHHSRPSIDVLFESAADVYGRGLLGIVLTGGNEDGADGLAAVRERGGLTVVQEAAGAYATAMIEAALSRVEADHVGPLGAITVQLRRQGTK
jgi:two-component system chemotaxis response regulator CheB